MKTLNLSIAALSALLALASFTFNVRGDEPCGRGGCPALQFTKGGGDCHGGFCPAALYPAASTYTPPVDARPLPIGAGPTVVYVAPYVAHPFAAVIHAVRCRIHQAGCQVKATAQTVRTQQPVRSFIRNHRPHIRCR
jgi:hypothetical protein